MTIAMLQPTTNMYWTEGQVELSTFPRCERTQPTEHGSVEEISASFSAWYDSSKEDYLGFYGSNHPVVYDLQTGWDSDQGCFLKVGFVKRIGGSRSVFRGVELTYRPWQTHHQEFSQHLMAWSRSNDVPLTDTQEDPKGDWETNKALKVATGFEVLFHILLQAGIPGLNIGSLGHDMACELLGKQLVASNTAPKITFSPSDWRDTNEKRRMIQLCAKLILRAPSDQRSKGNSEDTVQVARPHSLAIRGGPTNAVAAA